MNGTIYALRDPLTGEPRYVGQTINDPERRLYAHIQSSRKKNGGYCRNWIRQLLAEDLLPVLTVLQDDLLTAEELHEAERYWISLGLERGWRLTNVTAGGDQSPMLVPEVAARAIANSKKTRQTPEFSALSSAVATKRWQNPDYRKKVTEAHLGQCPTGIGARGRLANPAEPNPMADPDVRERMRATKKARWVPEMGKRHGDRMRALWADPEYRKRQSESHKRKH